jgi:CSLREA domain-containing protein
MVFFVFFVFKCFLEAAMKKTLFLSTLILLLFSVNFYAATCRVTKAADTNDGSCTAGDCSLREAVVEPTCTVIDFSLDLVGVPVGLTQGEIFIGRKLAIQGWGADAITISGNNLGWIFNIANPEVVISGVTLTGGNGGAVRGGTITLDRVYVTGNHTDALLGIIRSSYIVLRNSTIAGNYAPVHNFDTAVIVTGHGEITNSSICDNSGAAIYTSGGLIAAYNSTIANNAPQGIIIQDAGIFTVGNSIAIGAFTDHSFRGDFESLGNNIVRDAPGSWPMFYGTTDLPNVDPMLAPVAYQGGHIPVCAVLPGSPAIDAGNNAIAINQGLTTDQRGHVRIFDGNGNGTATVDIGAFEFGAPAALAPVSISGRVLTPGGQPVRLINVSLTDLQGNALQAFTSSLGWFTFDQVPAGGVYRISISSKRYLAPEKTIFADQTLIDADIIVTGVGGRGISDLK